MIRYRYAYDKTDRTFTESDWLTRAWDHFERMDNDTDITYQFFLDDVFADHLRVGTIVEAGIETIQPTTTEESCPFCKSRSHKSAESLRPYPCAQRSVGLCLHSEDALMVANMSPGDSISARASGPFPAVNGTIRKVYPTGYVDVYDGGYYFVRASRIYAHTKSHKESKKDGPDKPRATSSPARKPPPPRDNATRATV